jgi:predicted RNA-binding protein
MLVIERVLRHAVLVDEMAVREILGPDAEVNRMIARIDGDAESS